MMCSTAAFLAVALSITFAVATPNLIVEKSPQTPVSVKVKCDGVDFTKLSLSENTLAGHVLEDAYNSIHASADNDDSQLSGLTYRGSGSSMLGNAAAEEENLKWSWPFRRSTNFGVWYGYWDCTLCPNDDDPSILKGWENAIVAGLLASAHEAFQKVKTCEINMSPRTQDATAGLPNVSINLLCGKNKDLSALSVSKGTFLAHTLQSSYNKVHGDAANDDSSLDKVFYHKSPTKSMMLGDAAELQGYGGATGQRSPGLSGWWGCRLCPHNSDGEMLLGAYASDAALKAWEAELAFALQMGPFDYFRNMDACDIKLIPHSLTEEADEAHDGPPCGIRGGGCEGAVTEK